MFRLVNIDGRAAFADPNDVALRYDLAGADVIGELRNTCVVGTGPLAT